MHRAVFSLRALLWLSCAFAGDKTAASADHADVSIRLGNAWLDRREYDLAISEYDKALLADPRAAMAFAGRGLAHLGKKQRELARQDLDSAAAIDPRNPVVPRGRGMLALRARNFTQAVADFSDSLALEPNSALSLQGRAEAYLQSGDSEKALTDINAVIRHWPAWTGMYLFGANVLRRQGRPEEALHQADAVLAAAPTIPAYLARAGFRPNADLAGRRADAEAALSLDFNWSPARILLANVQFDAAEYTGAVATLDKTMAIHGETAELLTWRGIVYARSDQAALGRRISARRAQKPLVLAPSTICAGTWRRPEFI